MVTALFDVVAIYPIAHRGMGIDQISVFMEELTDSLHCLCIIGVITVKIMHSRLHLRGYLVKATILQLLHKSEHGLRISARQLVQKTFEVTGDEDVHGRADGS